MRITKWMSVVAAGLLLVACRGHESVSGNYGNGVVSGEIVMASSMANANPAGVRVGVAGTGLSAVVGADGRFAFAGVPEGAQLLFAREADGVNARLALGGISGPLIVELSQSSASLKRHRASGTAPYLQFEGTLTDVQAAQVTLHDSHGNDDVLLIALTTKIFLGNVIRTAADLKTGMRVHASATADAKGALTAANIQIQDTSGAEPGDGSSQTMTANGTVTEVGTSSLKVSTVAHGVVTVNFDSSTTIRKQGTLIKLADIKVGWEVNTMGKRVDDHTEQAIQIEVRGVSDNPGGGHH